MPNASIGIRANSPWDILPLLSGSCFLSLFLKQTFDLFSSLSLSPHLRFSSLGQAATLFLLKVPQFLVEP